MVSAHLKNISQIGNLPQIGVNIKKKWNHHLEKNSPKTSHKFLPITSTGSHLVPPESHEKIIWRAAQFFLKPSEMPFISSYSKAETFQTKKKTHPNSINNSILSRWNHQVKFDCFLITTNTIPPTSEVTPSSGCGAWQVVISLMGIIKTFCCSITFSKKLMDKIKSQPVVMGKKYPMNCFVYSTLWRKLI